ncbi:MAG: Fe-S protein assembly co-chaperone HscB [Granulosicoccus sp.]
MSVDFTSSHFELFDLPVHFDIDSDKLLSRFRELQKELHPDKFAAAADSEKRWSMQAASLINQAYQTLADDLSRAVYLLDLNGISTDEETDTRMDPEFLMDQMELRESLEGARLSEQPWDELNTLRATIRDKSAAQYKAFSLAASETNWTAARTAVRQWQFFDKLSREAKSLEEKLDL